MEGEGHQGHEEMLGGHRLIAHLAYPDSPGALLNFRENKLMLKNTTV